MNTSTEHLAKLAAKLHAEKYSAADVMFLAGSLIRGEGTKASDLDIVVVYRTLPNAYRDSYRFGEWPVEAFVHDPQTLKYFIDKVDSATGVPSLASMVYEGIEIPASTELSRQLKAAAKAALDAGPPRWQAYDIDKSRYVISDLIEDIKEPRTTSELYATASQLYHAIADHFLRSKGLWSAKGKSIPRRLRSVDGDFCDRFESAFDLLFTRGMPNQVISLAGGVLSSDGGTLFSGYRVDAPTAWRAE